MPTLVISEPQLKPAQIHDAQIQILVSWAQTTVSVLSQIQAYKQVTSKLTNCSLTFYTYDW